MSILSIVNEEEEEDEANVSKDGGLNLQDLPNCVQLAAKELSVFAKALTIDPGMAYRPGSSKTREVIPGETTMRAIGSHRVGAAEIIAMMLQLGCLEIDEKMAHLKLEETNDESKPDDFRNAGDYVVRIPVVVRISRGGIESYFSCVIESSREALDAVGSLRER